MNREHLRLLPLPGSSLKPDDLTDVLRASIQEVVHRKSYFMEALELLDSAARQLLDRDEEDLMPDDEPVASEIRAFLKKIKR